MIEISILSTGGDQAWRSGDVEDGVVVDDDDDDDGDGDGDGDGDDDDDEEILSPEGVQAWRSGGW